MSIRGNVVLPSGLHVKRAATRFPLRGASAICENTKLSLRVWPWREVAEIATGAPHGTSEEVGAVGFNNPVDHYSGRRRSKLHLYHESAEQFRGAVGLLEPADAFNIPVPGKSARACLRRD